MKLARRSDVTGLARLAVAEDDARLLAILSLSSQFVKDRPREEFGVKVGRLLRHRLPCLDTCTTC